MNKSQHAIFVSGMLIALLAVAIPLSSESFARPSSGGGGKTTFDFNVDLSQNNISIAQGTSQTINVLVNYVSGSGTVSLSAANMPAGITISFNPISSKISSTNPSFSSIMTIDASSTAKSGIVDIQASGKGITKPSSLILTISDLIPPQTAIDSNPTNPSNSTSASFAFTSTESGTFECKIDTDTYLLCTSPKSYSSLSDGSHTFYVRAIDNAGNTDSTPASYTWTIDTTPPPPNDPVIVAAGDIACNSNTATSTTCHHQATSDLIMTINPVAVLTLGDNQYNSGELSNYNSFYDPTWGRAFDKTYPSPGNHEYQTAGAAGYFNYFGTRAGTTSNGYYSFDIGTWHIVSLNSNCGSIGGCDVNSPQSLWLDADLSSHNNACTLVYWHHPRFSAGSHGDNTAMNYFWQLLVANNVDIALAGHDHNYQRFAPMDLTGSEDPNGVREFVVGTGGKSHYTLDPTVHSTLEAYDTSTHGVLKLTLHDTSYDWKFVGESGNIIDSGSWDCNVN